MKILLLLLVVVLTLPFTKAAEEMLGASQVLAQLQEANPKKDNAAAGVEAFKTKLSAYKSASAKLAPETAASDWIALVQGWHKEWSKQVEFTRLMQVIPGPAAWPELQKIIEKTSLGNPFSDQLLRLIGSTLNKDDAARWTAFKSLSDLSSQPKKSNFVMSASSRQITIEDYQFSQIASAMIKLTDDPEKIIQALEIQIAKVAENEESRDSRYRRTIAFPRLISRVGAAKTRELFSKALAANAVLSLQGDEERELARSLVLEQIDTIKAPQWALISDLSASSLNLYEAMAKKYPVEAVSATSRSGRTYRDYEEKRARGFYFLALVAAQKTTEATAFAIGQPDSEALELPGDSMDRMAAAGAGDAYYNLIKSILETNPDLPFWRDFVTLSARRHSTDDFLALAKKLSGRSGLTPAQKDQVLEIIGAAYFAHGQVEEGIANLRERLVTAKAALASNTDENDISEARRSVTEMSNRLIKLGTLLKRKELQDEGLKESLAAQIKSEEVSRELVLALMDAKRGAEAEKLVVDAMKAKLKQDESPYQRLSCSDELRLLAEIYGEAGRPADVLLLLKNAPWWGAEDVTKFLDETGYRLDVFGVIIARALKATGDTAKALDVLHTTLKKSPGDDSAYALLLELQGDQAIPFLDQQVVRDQFEERPLIWKAFLQLKSGDNTAAEKTVRVAISIDPSDGEKGKGDRMRAYAVLADVLEAQGKSEDAKIYRGAVQAIRISENADDFREVGLLKQAVEMYEDALKHFSDAYCIQSRLAIQLAQLGEMEKAEEHYRRAYELMPNSFGRVESHCFGCEKAFKGEIAETTAERTFRKMLENDPKKPQLHYLFGYLRLEQERYPEALSSFQKAVELDPDYINAWKKIGEIGDQTTLPVAQRDEAIVNLLRLDPLRKHGASDSMAVSDLKRLWEAVETSQKSINPNPSEPIFPLVASAAVLAQARTKAAKVGYYESEDEEEDFIDAGKAISEQPLIKHAGEVLTQISRAQM